MFRTIVCGALLAASTSMACAVGPVNPIADADESRCSEGGDRQQVECLSHRIDRLTADLARAYGDALAKLPEVDDRDLRGGRDQLRRSETAWLQYKDANCPLIGAMEGGSNLWITHFAALCETHELQARIKLLRGIADGNLGDH